MFVHLIELKQVSRTNLQSYMLTLFHVLSNRFSSTSLGADCFSQNIQSLLCFDTMIMAPVMMPDVDF